MKKIVLLVVAAVMLVVALAVITSASAAPLPAGDAGRGAYIFALAGGCGCHGANLAGFNAAGPPFGEEFALGPAGTVFAKNITQDKTTGIGSWTDEQIANAIRNGVDDEGKQLFPVMPYTEYHFMSDADVADLVAFLRTVPPISNAVPEDKLNGPVPPVPPLPPSPATSPTGTGADRGQYIVSAVSGCSDCHTPKTPAGAPDMTKLLAGNAQRLGPVSLVGPNITPDQSTGIGTWTSDQIATYLQQGVGPNGRLADNFMGEVINGLYKGLGFHNLTNDDAAAIAAYLKSIPAVSNVPRLPPPPPAPPTPAAPAALVGGANAATAVPLKGIISGVLAPGKSAWFSFSFPGGSEGVLMNFVPTTLKNSVGFNAFIHGGTLRIGGGTQSGLSADSKYWRIGGGPEAVTIEVFNNSTQSAGIAIGTTGSTFPPAPFTVPNP